MPIGKSQFEVCAKELADKEQQAIEGRQKMEADQAKLARKEAKMVAKRKAKAAKASSAP